MPVALDTEDRAVLASLEAPAIEASGTTFGSLAIGSRYPLNQFQHSPAAGVPQAGTESARCFHWQAPACRLEIH